MKTKIYKIMCAACTTVALSSCLDTVILPDDITVGEDFWQKKSDVSMMVNAAYQGMTTENVMERLIVWGDFRSDEMVQAGSPEGAIPNALAEVAMFSSQVTNRYATWSDFYAVINRCNIVLEKAADVLAADPNYTEGDYLTDRSQMLALRSLCYFYLVRNFRDVPYVDEAYMTSSKERTFVQTPPAEVLQHCIESLEEAAANAIKAEGYSDSDWRRVGWFTFDGINSLLADIYLWRASVLHSAEDYQKAVECCDKVIASKKAMHKQSASETFVQEYPLARARNAYEELFVTQNAEESIFELQVKANPALCKYLYKFANNNSTEGFLKASNIFSKDDNIANITTAVGAKVFPVNDMRYFSTIFSATANDESFNIRKMISNNAITSLTAQPRATVSRTYADIDQNYIIYRLPDVMLMKAEALVQLADTAMAGLSDEEKTTKQAAVDLQLRQAFNLVQAVNTRSLLDDNKGDSIKWDNLRTMGRTGKTGMELLVMEERLRELCFEGKRWYDLLRYNYRHVSGVNYSSIMGDQGLSALPANSNDFLDVTTRGKANASGLKAKMANEAYLYLPIPNSDAVLATQLKQNPAYGSTNQFERK